MEELRQASPACDGTTWETTPRESAELIDKALKEAGSQCQQSRPATQLRLVTRFAPDTSDEEDAFGIEAGTLQLVDVPQRRWTNQPKLPLPLSSEGASPILQEFTRTWRVLRLKAHTASNEGYPEKAIPTEKSLLKNYEPRAATVDATFPSELQIPAFLQPRIAVDDTPAFLVTPNIRFALGMIEPLFCRMMIYDTHLGCRATEEFSFTLPGSSQQKPIQDSASLCPESSRQPSALFYTLANHQPHHLFVVLKVSKVLLGDGDSTTAPYCNPDKFSAPTEQQRLRDRANDCVRRLGRYRQPIAWGAVTLSVGLKRSMTLYRQRTTMSDDQRLLLIADAVKGTLKEKVIPSVCELEIERLDEHRLEESKFQTEATMMSVSMKLQPTRILKVHDPFSVRKTSTTKTNQPESTSESSNAEAELPCVACREVQPFCHPLAMSVFGHHGSGPIVVSYINAIYMYPIHVEKFQFRNVAVRAQLLQKEVKHISAVDNIETLNSAMNAFYGPDQEISSAAYSHVNYHQKNPQFETEMKMSVPERLTMEHHVLFSFYHVHCKKLLPDQPQQELVGYAVLPILLRDGTLLPDSTFTMNIILTPPMAKNSTGGGSISLPSGYVDDARDLYLDQTKTSFTCRIRALSSMKSQDSTVAAFLAPFQSNILPNFQVVTVEQVVDRLCSLRHANTITVRHFFLPIVRFILTYMRFGHELVRWASFRALLIVLEKASWTPHRMSNTHEVNQILNQFVYFVFDEHAIEQCELRAHATSKEQTATNVHPRSVVQAVAREWLKVMKDTSPTEEIIEARRRSLTYSHVLLQLILKSMAMTATCQEGKSSAKVPLPARLVPDDDILIEELLHDLIRSTTNASSGLLLQKEVNHSIAYFCRGLFLVSTSTLPIRIIKFSLEWTYQTQSDVNVTVHILFPFLNILMDFEFFAMVNGFKSTSKNHSRRGAWLARLIFERLLHVVDEEAEDRIRSEALRLLRRMFVNQAYNPHHQTTEQQELMALMYFPMIPSIARFATDGKLLSVSDSIEGSESNETERSQEFRKELLICVGHLLSSVSLPYLTWYFRQSSFSNAIESTSQNSQLPLSPTAALMRYRKFVDETKTHTRDQRCPSIVQQKSQHVLSPADRPDQKTAYDEVRVHACLSLVRQLIEVFLVDESMLPSSHFLLSPDIVPQERRLSLLDIENHLKHRQSHHRELRAGSLCLDVVSAAVRASTNGGSKSPVGRGMGGSGSFSFSMASPATTPSRPSGQKSLPRNWGKNYATTQRRTSQNSTCNTRHTISSPSHSVSSSGQRRGSAVSVGPEKEEDEDGTCFESNLSNLHRIIAETALRALRTAVDQFEWIIRIIEAPLDYRTNSAACNGNVTIDEAFSLLGSVVDIYFLLMKRASAIECLCTSAEGQRNENVDEDSDSDEGCFLAELFRHLQSFLMRFQRALFATRIAGLPLVHDQSRIYLLVSLSATARLSSVRNLVATLLCKLILVCYEQTGSFLLINRPILKVFCANFFSPLPPSIPPEALRGAVELWRHYSFADDRTTDNFEIQFADFLNGLTTQIKVFEMWQEAMAHPDDARDNEVIEDGLHRISRSLSPLWLLEVKTQWMTALLQLHVSRKQFAEASCCKLEILKFKETVSRSDSTATGREHAFDWEIQELRAAHELAERAGWYERMIDISERLLVSLRTSQRFTEYQDVLRRLDVTVTRLLASQSEHARGMYVFYRVVYVGDCVPWRVSRNEYIYKRNKFVSLGDFVGEMNAALRARYPHCERVDVVPESKPFPAFNDQPNVIFMRITSLERVAAAAGQFDQQRIGTTLSFSTPYTVGNSSYGKTSEQMKRVTYLHTEHPFPYVTVRQVVTSRHEELRCPIDNSMDDIRKRCKLLEDEIDKEASDCTDLKTLTLVLKGSVDTHVHGGIPEVIDAFLVASAEHTGPTHDDRLVALLDVTGNRMDSEQAMQKRRELAELLVRFITLCWTCLLISRAAYRRTLPPQTLSSSTGSSFFGGDNTPSSVTAAGAGPAGIGGATKLPSSSSSSDQLLAAIPISITTSSALDDDFNLSPLQVEFEKSFAILVELMRSKVCFSFPRMDNLLLVHQQVQGRRGPAGGRTMSVTAAAGGINVATAALAPAILHAPPPPPPLAVVATASASAASTFLQPGTRNPTLIASASGTTAPPPASNSMAASGRVVSS